MELNDEYLYIFVNILQYKYSIIIVLPAEGTVWLTTALEVQCLELNATTCSYMLII
jgi:hypothetical protein